MLLPHFPETMPELRYSGAQRKMQDLQKGEPWLGVNPNYKEINVETQLTDSDSLLSFYKKLTALREKLRNIKKPLYTEPSLHIRKNGRI